MKMSSLAREDLFEKYMPCHGRCLHRTRHWLKLDISKGPLHSTGSQYKMIHGGLSKHWMNDILKPASKIVDLEKAASDVSTPPAMDNIPGAQLQASVLDACHSTDINVKAWNYDKRFEWDILNRATVELGGHAAATASYVLYKRLPARKMTHSERFVKTTSHHRTG